MKYTWGDLAYLIAAAVLLILGMWTINYSSYCDMNLFISGMGIIAMGVGMCVRVHERHQSEDTKLLNARRSALLYGPL